ncbi:MAG: D-alanyl-D-alanine carboxypeptidase [Coriobacteriales bacterium]|jgi:D-alanyl-D-alanine carboxypeptidase (penicillin-binding protein 5/6)|nr:D-alanyl-D-alanine carboxypeptidase [Coriobacteriales bacterium]
MPQGSLRRSRALCALLLALLIFSSGVPGSAPYRAFADVRESDRIGTERLDAVDPPILDAPDIAADYAALATEEGVILWERGGEVSVPMASMTKLMTAVVALEHCDPETPMLVTYGAATADGSSASLWEGDTTTFHDLLIGMMVPSGNDAALAIAENVAGTEFAFVDLMNEKAAELSMTSSHFSNASGIIDEENYTTPRDYLLLVRHAMQQPLLREVVGQPEAWAYFGGREEHFVSTNQLFHMMEGVTGIKTGFTDAAGYCFVGAVKRGDLELYAVIFHSSDENQRFLDAQTLLEWGFTHYRSVELIKSETPVAELALLSWIDKSVEVCAAARVEVSVFDYAGPITQELELAEWEGTVVKGDVVGSIIWSQGGEVLATCDALAVRTVPEPDFWEGVGISLKRFWGGLFGDPAHLETKILLPEIF